jgi:nitrite reductase (NO-forming)
MSVLASPRTPRTPRPSKPPRPTLRSVALLHARIPDERWSTAWLATANLAVAGLLVGVWTATPELTVVSAALLVAAAIAHLVTLVRLGRGALGGRLNTTCATPKPARTAWWR